MAGKAEGRNWPTVGIRGPNKASLLGGWQCSRLSPSLCSGIILGSSQGTNYMQGKYFTPCITFTTPSHFPLIPKLIFLTQFLTNISDLNEETNLTLSLELLLAEDFLWKKRSVFVMV